MGDPIDLTTIICLHLYIYIIMVILLVDEIPLLKKLFFTTQSWRWLSKNHHRLCSSVNFVNTVNISKMVFVKPYLNLDNFKFKCAFIPLLSLVSLFLMHYPLFLMPSLLFPRLWRRHVWKRQGECPSHRSIFSHSFRHKSGGSIYLILYKPMLLLSLYYFPILCTLSLLSFLLSFSFSFFHSIFSKFMTL